MFGVEVVSYGSNAVTRSIACPNEAKVRKVKEDLRKNLDHSAFYIRSYGPNGRTQIEAIVMPPKKEVAHA
jgi:hypothetical protein